MFKTLLILKSSVEYIPKPHQNNFKDKTYNSSKKLQAGILIFVLNPMRNISVVISVKQWPKRP